MWWPPKEIQLLERKLDELAETIREVDPEMSDEVRGWLCRLLVVRSCGYLEQVVVEISRAYIDAKSGGYVHAFARSWLERSRNPSFDNLIDGIQRFDGRLRDEFENFMEADDERRLRDLHLLVDRRHKIAHGLNEGVATVQALRLYSAAKEIADWFVLRMNPSPMPVR